MSDSHLAYAIQPDLRTATSLPADKSVHNVGRDLRGIAALTDQRFSFCRFDGCSFIDLSIDRTSVEIPVSDSSMCDDVDCEKSCFIP